MGDVDEPSDEVTGGATPPPGPDANAPLGTRDALQFHSHVVLCGKDWPSLRPCRCGYYGGIAGAHELLAAMPIAVVPPTAGPTGRVSLLRPPPSRLTGFARLAWTGVQLVVLLGSVVGIFVVLLT